MTHAQAIRMLRERVLHDYPEHSVSFRRTRSDTKIVWLNGSRTWEWCLLLPHKANAEQVLEVLARWERWVRDKIARESAA